MFWATERDITAAVNGQWETYDAVAAKSHMPQTGDDPELPPAPTDAPQRGDAEPGHARPDIDLPDAESPELPPEAFPNPEPNQPMPERQGDAYDGPGEMETPPAHVPPLPSGGELPEEQPDRPSRPSTNADRQSVPDWPT